MTATLTWRGALVGFLASAIAAGLSLALWAAAAPAAAWLLVDCAIAIVALGIGALLFRSSDRTVQAVRGTAAQIADGTFEARVTDAAGPLTDLRTSFNSMAARVEGLFAQVAADQARLEAVFDASADGMVAVSNDAVVRLLNSAARTLLDAPASAVGRPLIEAARDYELDALVRRVAGAGPAATAETAVITFGPGRIPLRAAAVPIPGGGEWAVLLMLTDLTEVARVDQMRRDFLSNVSHELRTPLASVRALAETLEAGDVEPGEETAEFVGRIRQQVDRLATLVNELLDLSRIESGAVDLKPEPIDLAELAAESASLLRSRAEKAEVTVNVPATPGPTVEADRASMLRVINNLVDNAIKYSPRGSTVTVAAEDGGELASVTVRDEGPGIQLADIPRVFERFYKGDHSRADSGVGLGLAIVKHVVRAHGGTAEVASTPGRGATFTVRLPKRFAGRAVPH